MGVVFSSDGGVFTVERGDATNEMECRSVGVVGYSEDGGGVVCSTEGCARCVQH